MMGYIAQGKGNIRIHKDITGEMWFVDGVVIQRKFIYIFKKGVRIVMTLTPFYRGVMASRKPTSLRPLFGV